MSIVLLGAILVIGDAIGNPATGIPQLLTQIFEPLATDTPWHIFLLATISWVVMQTNIMSNMISATLVYKTMVPAAIAAGIGNPTALGFCIGGASSYAFCLPSATAATAIVIGSGWVPIRMMARYGLVLAIPVILLFTFVAYPFAALILQ